MNEDSWLEAAYEDRNGGEVDTAELAYWDDYQDEDAECDRTWTGTRCGGEIVPRTTAGGFRTYTCEYHLCELDEQLQQIADRYPEINHPASCTCWGCSDGSY